MTESALPLDLGFVEEGREARRRIARRRRWMAVGVSAGITVVWLVYVTAATHWDRILDNWAAGTTMVFGSFVAGSTPQGGGAVAFPVFTKGLEIPSDVARSFSLSIQAVGMSAATAAILINRRRVEWRAVAVGLPVAAGAFLIAVWLLGDGSEPFRPPIVPSSYVKVSFTLVVASMAFITYLGSRVKVREVVGAIPVANHRTLVVLTVLAAIGGIAAAFTGSGADVFLYLFLAVLLAVDAKVGVPTSVVVMAGISLLGILFLGLIDGQLSVSLSGDRVVSVGGEPVDLPAAQADLFGLWLAAVPIVAWGAPLGAWAASKISTRRLLQFVILLAAIEVISTILFLDDLRTDPWLATYAVLGMAALGWGLWWIAANRERFFALPDKPTDRTLTRSNVDAQPDYGVALTPRDTEGTTT